MPRGGQEPASDPRIGVRGEEGDPPWRARLSAVPLPQKARSSRAKPPMGRPAQTAEGGRGEGAVNPHLGETDGLEASGRSHSGPGRLVGLWKDTPHL